MKYLIKGKLYNPVKVGDAGDWYAGEPNSRCGDCKEKYGEYHLDGCDVERVRRADCKCCPATAVPSIKSMTISAKKS